jgi:anti-anti-sigma regulatory factor
MSLRRVSIVLLGVQAFGALLILLGQLFIGGDLTTIFVSLAGAVAFFAMFMAYMRGWEPARGVAVVTATLLTGLGIQEPYLTQELSITFFIPPIMALILTGPAWVAGSSVAVLLMLIVRAGGVGPYVDPVTIILYAMIVGGMILGRIVTDTALRDAEANAERAEESRLKSEAQAQEVAQKAEELARQNDEQRRLLDLVATLETPAVAMADGVLLAPVVGHLDSRRAQAFTSRLLRAVSEQRTRLVIIDIAGVPTVDTQVAHALLQATQAIRLLGCEVSLTGISATVAATMTQLGINMAGVTTARTPQEALEVDVIRPARKPAVR